MKAPAYTAKGVKRKGQVRLPEAYFDGTVNEAALHQAVTAIRANARQGTHATKTRQTVSGGNSKPWRQKGTGRARAGSTRSPLWRGGAITFGPQPRSYVKRVPRRVRALAIRSALNARALEGDLIVVEPLEMSEPRTKAVVELLAGLGAEDRKVLILTDGTKRGVCLSARNLPGVQVRAWGEASAYDILWSDVVVAEETALSGAPRGGQVEPQSEEESR